MTKKEIHAYANECVKRLGELVGEMRLKGKECGFSDEETKKVWLTTFSIFAEHQAKLQKEVMSKNLGTLLK